MYFLRFGMPETGARVQIAAKWHDVTNVRQCLHAAPMSRTVTCERSAPGTSAYQIALFEFKLYVRNYQQLSFRMTFCILRFDQKYSPYTTWNRMYKITLWDFRYATDKCSIWCHCQTIRCLQCIPMPASPSHVTDSDKCARSAAGTSLGDLLSTILKPLIVTDLFQPNTWPSWMSTPKRITF